MQTKFKRHQKVRLLKNPDPEYMEYHNELNDEEQIPIIKGMIGEINLVLPTGDYHVKFKDEHGHNIAFVKMAEEDLEAA